MACILFFCSSSIPAPATSADKAFRTRDGLCIKVGGGREEGERAASCSSLSLSLPRH